MSDRLRVLAILDRLIPSNIIGLIKPMLAMQKAKEISFRMRYTWFYAEKDIQNCDVLLLCRNISPKDLKLIELAKKHDKAIIFDIDDNFFELPVETPIGKFHRNPVHLFVVSEMLKQADAVRVYSAPMLEISKSLNPNSFLLKSYFDFSMLENVKRENHKPIKIVYATSRVAADDFLASTYIPALIRILEEYKDRVEFYSFGTLPHQLLEFPNAKKLPYQHNYTSFIKFFYSQGFDIGLAPLLDDVVHNSKTNNKFREYGAMGVCGIYSNAQIYRDCVNHKENGILTDNTVEGWYESLRLLIENENNIRAKIASAAEKDVKSNYSFEGTVDDWRHLLSMVSSAENRKEYNNIMNLKLLIVMDDFFLPTIDLRFEPLAQLMGFTGIYNDRIRIFEATSEKLSQYDVVVYFPKDNGKLDITIEYLSKLCSHLIVDTVKPYSCEHKRDNVIFSNSIELISNQQRIADLSYKENVDILKAAYEKILIDDESDKISDVIFSAFQKKQNLSEHYYSRESSIFLWANLLQPYKGSLGLHHVSFLARLLNALLKPFKKAGRKLLRVIRPVTTKLRLIRSKSHILFVVLLDYFKINVKKNY
ncbi:glycosyltransferase family protein [Paenibacillus glufosinatiresistens]|uniref:glycosyltransferase n=1 Tax=Paenibacillus glufosinatiresistens TaxID=3070657 RepID=UPI00286E277B|nr:glycosyltransferase [Paenibacillus sp. YX.27]